MVDEVIAPLSEEWMIPSDLENRVAGWERSAGVRLEASYRSFLMSYNGGRPYPNVFDVAIPENIWGSSDRQTFLDQLYDFDYATSLYDKEIYGAGTPHQFFFIGSNPGGLELLMSMRPQDAGAVYCWSGTDVPWATGANTEAALFAQAPSFPAFVASLYDTPDKIGYDYWESPRHKQLSLPFVVK